MSIKSDIQRYFEQHPNEKLYLTDIAVALEYTTKQIQATTGLLIKDGWEGLEIAIRGQAWIFKPSSDGINGTLNVIGVTQKGSLILEDSENILWIAKKFDD